jgi:mevalonate kinase
MSSSSGAAAAAAVDSSSSSSVCASAPGKVILFGEHAVVYGEPALAACLSDLRIWVKITRSRFNQLEVMLPDLPNVPPNVVIPASNILKLSLQRPPTSQDTDQIQKLLLQLNANHNETSIVLNELALSALTPVVYLVHQLASSFLRDGPGSSSKCGLIILVRSKDLPVGAGLGSSAAFSVACAAALVRLTLWNPASITSSSNEHDENEKYPEHYQPNRAQLEMINQYAFYSEMLLHGTPSGIDNTVSTFGGAIVYTKDTFTGEVTMETLSNFPSLDLVLTNTHVPRSTKQLVGHVREMYRQHNDVVQPILQAMGAITRYERTTQRLRKSSCMLHALTSMTFSTHFTSFC